MRSFAKIGFIWPFVVGFLIGAIGLVALEPLASTRTLADTIATAVHLNR